jgi:hypothetical protein
MKNAVDAVSSPGSVGTATKWLTRTTNSPFLRSGRRGVITSSRPSRRQPARAPSTVTPGAASSDGAELLGGLR